MSLRTNIAGKLVYLHNHVMRKPRIQTILGLFAQTSGLTFVHAILGLSDVLREVCI